MLVGNLTSSTRVDSDRLQIIGEPVNCGLREIAPRSAKIESGRWGALLLPLRVDEVEDLILDDRSAHREAVLRLAVVVDIRLRARERLITTDVVRGTMQVVRSALRHGIDEKADEVALTNVERREKNLIFLDRLDADRLTTRLTAGLAGRAKPKEIGLTRTVDLDLIVPIVDTARGEASSDPGSTLERCGDLRNERHEIGEITIKAGQSAQRRIGYCGADASMGGRNHRTAGLASDVYRAECSRLFAHAQVDAAVLTQLDHDASLFRGLESYAPHCDGVGPSDFKAGDRVEAVCAAYATGARASGGVCDLHLGRFNTGARGICDDARYSTCRDTLGGSAHDARRWKGDKCGDGELPTTL